MGLYYTPCSKTACDVSWLLVILNWNNEISTIYIFFTAKKRITFWYTDMQYIFQQTCTVMLLFSHSLLGYAIIRQHMLYIYSLYNANSHAQSEIVQISLYVYTEWHGETIKQWHLYWDVMEILLTNCLVQQRKNFANLLSPTKIVGASFSDIGDSAQDDSVL